ncbi:hypothetical protein [Myroides odoratus]|uniref:hypothetical protein n=1 Tax=Myroides odoratus TaxID=256 RepID=UPI0039AEED51
MQETLSLESSIVIFEIEETDDDLVFEKEEIQYIQLFPVDYAIALIDFDLELKDKGYSNLKIAQMLLEYRKKMLKMTALVFSVKQSKFYALF